MVVVAAAAVSWPHRAATAQGADTLAQCDGLPVQAVHVRPDRPVFEGALAWWRKLARSLGLHHQTTSRGVVRRFVTLDPGSVCTEFRRSESQRILRAQPYIADATVLTTPVGGGGGDSVRVDVSTIDEVSVVAAARVRGASLQALSLGTLNLRGAGIHAEGRWENGRVYRAGYGGRLIHSQLLGRPYSLTVDGMRRPIGEDLLVALSHGFLTDLQRIAWQASYWTSKDFARLRKPDRVELAQPVDRYMWNVGGVVRFGPPRRLGLLGGMILGERVEPRHEFSIVDSATGRFLTPTDTVGVRKYDPYDETGIAGVLGVRALRFTRMRLDALGAEQDVGTGVQVGTMIGGRPFSGVPLRNSFASIDAYAAGRTERNFVGARVEAESRVDLERLDWRHLIASGRAAWYFAPRETWISELSVEGAAGWRTIVPFQLEVGERQSGVRGYAGSHEAGGQRLLARLEQRVDLGRYRASRAAFGGALFVDAGTVWRGDVPFGVNAPVRTSIGAAVLAAVPARSRRTIRGELAIPLSGAPGARAELRFTVREPTRGFWFEPRRVRWVRLSAVPEQIFSWP